MTSKQIDFTPLLRTMIGADRLNAYYNQYHWQGQPNYPPYNIKLIGEHSYKLEMALAGFSADEITVYTQEDNLTIMASKPDAESMVEQSKETMPQAVVPDSNPVTYLHKGISTQKVNRTFALAENVEIMGVSFIDGILTVNMERKIPETQALKEFKIRTK